MSKITDKMKEELIEEIFSETELDNYMDYNRFVRVQEDENGKDEIIKYMNDRHQI